MLFLLNLLKLPADSADAEFYPKRFRWGQIAPEFLINPKQQPEETHPCQLTSHVYHLIWGIKLAPRTPLSINTSLIYQNLQELHNIADGVAPMKDEYCQLCKTHLDDHQTLRVHLSTRRHQQHVMWLNSVVDDPPCNPQSQPRLTRTAGGSNEGRVLPAVQNPSG
ncbi:uncharacterized protein LOC108253370 [Diaphorina citri]|uniref:Uncharacterized protein LOC108253370 n=1 Tax=Diaphorina citri TaxID=121845 RepID=A0A3Q0JDZ7_DIACI|nr:uncharacterized protein LOC108253370 [Diaphorina citri]